jgi:hypothetical protein
LLLHGLSDVFIYDCAALSLQTRDVVVLPFVGERLLHCVLPKLVIDEQVNLVVGILNFQESRFRDFSLPETVANFTDGRRRARQFRHGEVLIDVVPLVRLCEIVHHHLVIDLIVKLKVLLESLCNVSLLAVVVGRAEPKHRRQGAIDVEVILLAVLFVKLSLVATDVNNLFAHVGVELLIFVLVGHCVLSSPEESFSFIHPIASISLSNKLSTLRNVSLLEACACHDFFFICLGKNVDFLENLLHFSLRNLDLDSLLGIVAEVTQAIVDARNQLNHIRQTVDWDIISSGTVWLF